MKYSHYDAALARLARAAEFRLYFRHTDWPSADAKRKAAKLVKWQCWLTHEEAATLDALRLKYGGLSRYALTRLAMLALIKSGEKDVKETPHNGRL